MSYTPRTKPYTLDIGPVGSIDVLRERLPELFTNTDFMLQQLYEDLALVADDVAAGGGGIDTIVDDTNVTGVISGTTLTLGWTGALGATRGGTGQSTVTQGDLLYGSAANTWSKLAKDANATRYLSNTGASNNPAWAQIDLTNGVTGVLPVANLPSSLTVYYATVPLSAAQIRSLNSSPVQIVAAPGAHKAIVPISAAIEVTVVSAMSAAGALMFSYAGGTTNLVSAGNFSPGLNSTGAPNPKLQFAGNAAVVSYAASLYSNTAINIRMTADVTGGDASIIASIAYYVATIA